MKKPPQFFKSFLEIPLFHYLWVFWKALTASWRIYLEKPVPVEELTHSREAASIPSFGFFFLLTCAAILASLGLLANSTPVIIGAMIVAPLMNPIMSMSFGMITGNWKLYKRAWITLILGTACTIFVSYLIATALPFNVVGSEILGRTSPNLIDLGIAIAAGAAGSFALTRHSIATSIAGVAIAVALVPPLCVVGIGLGVGENLTGQIDKFVISNLSVSSGAFLLFLANAAGIIFTACVVFISQSYGNLQKSFDKLVIWALIMALLCGPLTNSLQEFIISNRVGLEMRNIRVEKPDFWQESQIRYIGVALVGGTAYITFLINAPESLLTDEHLEYVQTRLFDAVSKMGIQAMDLNVRIIPVQIREYQSISEKP